MNKEDKRNNVLVLRIDGRQLERIVDENGVDAEVVILGDYRRRSPTEVYIGELLMKIDALTTKQDKADEVMTELHVELLLMREEIAELLASGGDYGG